MIRFIIKRESFDANSGLRTEEYVTVDAEVHELETLLASGGHGESGYLYHRLEGAEIKNSA